MDGLDVNSHPGTVDYLCSLWEPHLNTGHSLLTWQDRLWWIKVSYNASANAFMYHKIMSSNESNWPIYYIIGHPLADICIHDRRMYIEKSLCNVVLQQWFSYIDGLLQDCSSSIAYALEVQQSCTKPSGPWFNIKMSSNSIGIPIVEMRRSYDRLISTMGFHLLVRWHLYIELSPWV